MSECLIKHEINILNYKKDDRGELLVNCATVLIKGHVTKTNCCRYCDNISVIINKNEPVYFNVSKLNGKFKCLLKLRTKNNCLVFKCCKNSTKTIAFTYDPDENIKDHCHLKVLYIVCKGHDGRFQSPDSQHNSEEVACQRLSIGMQLIQCLIGEKLFERGYGRKTFQLISECVPFYSELSVDRAKSMSEHQLWDYFAREILQIDGTLDSKNIKYVAFLGCTEYKGVKDGNFSYDNVKARTVANAALGGGDLALFGTGCLYTWPNSTDEVIDCFQNDQEIKKDEFLDDSNSRSTYGGCFATTLGSVCHEIGHIFNLGHTVDGIMGNGIDYVNRVFTVDNLTEDLPERIAAEHKTEKTSSKSKPRFTSLKKPNTFLTKYQNQKDNDLTFFTENSAITLNFHKWLNTHVDAVENEFKYFPENRSVISTSCPIRLVEVRDTMTGMMRNYYPFLNEDIYEFLLPADVELKPGLESLFVIDNSGNVNLINC